MPLTHQWLEPKNLQANRATKKCNCTNIEIQRQCIKLYTKINVSQIYGSRSQNFTILKSQSRMKIKRGSQSRSRTEKIAESQSRTGFASTLQPWYQRSVPVILQKNVYRTSASFF